MPDTETLRKAYRVVDFAEIAGVPCPCGTARRAFGDVEEYPATIHVTEIAIDARLHYHRRLTETYYFLQCEPDAKIQLNDEILGVHPGSCIMIRQVAQETIGSWLRPRTRVGHPGLRDTLRKGSLDSICETARSSDGGR